MAKVALNCRNAIWLPSPLGSLFGAGEGRWRADESTQSLELGRVHLTSAEPNGLIEADALDADRVAPLLSCDDVRAMAATALSEGVERGR